MKSGIIILLSAIALGKPEILNRNGCPVDSNINLLLPHRKCNQYYQCLRGELVTRDCPGNLLFNPDTHKCDWPENVSCRIKNNSAVRNTPASSTNYDPNQAIAICAGEGSDGVIIAHEECNKFYVCKQSRPVVYQCDGNFLYNALRECCDWPQNVDCGDRIIGEGTGNGNSDPSEAPSICAAEDSDGILVAHEYCDKFYKCWQGLPSAMGCPSGLFFNPNKDICDWPNNVDCSNRIIPDEDPEDNNGENETEVEGGGGGAGNCDPSEAPSICAAEGSDGTLIAHENCNQFYKCAGGQPVALQCPMNLLFNPHKDLCDWPQNVICGDRVIPEEDDNNGDNGNGDNGNDSSASDESTDVGGGAGNDDPSEAPAICAANDSDGVLVAHENCNQYYKCVAGKPQALKCPANLLFNPNIDRCDWPKNVKCGDRVIPDEDVSSGESDSEGNDKDSSSGDESTEVGGGAGNDDPSEAPAICAANDSDGVLVAHENCNQYYKCLAGKPVALTCPANLLFNPNTDRCDWPKNVKCGDRVIPDEDVSSSESDSEGNDKDSSSGNESTEVGGGAGNDDPSEAPAICAANDSDGVLVAHENCNQYYKCLAGEPVALRCPANLVFNPSTDRCDWPTNVNCGDRVVPEEEEEDKQNDSDGDNENENNSNNSNGDDQSNNQEEENDSGSVEDDGNENNENGNGDNDNGGICNCNPDEAPSICAVPGSNDILVAHENCNQFYICMDGQTIALSCPLNLMYNPYTEQCDWPANVACGDRVIPDLDENEDNDESGVGVCNCNPKEAPSICATKGSQGAMIAHYNCNQFYICSGSSPTVLSCPSNLLYDPYMEQCNKPENVDCGSRTVPLRYSVSLNKHLENRQAFRH